MIQQQPQNKKIALVTGASRGIGAMTACALARDGFDLALNYRVSREKAEDLAARFRENGVSAFAFGADVSSGAEVARMLTEIRQKLGEPTALVCNAGLSCQKLLTDMTDEDWQRIIGTDLTGVFNCVRACLPAMIRSHAGRIVNIASMWGEVGGSMEAAYSAAKAGVIGLTKALAKEVGPSGITVNAVSPGVIMTDMMASFSAADVDALKEETPLEALGTPSDVAEAVAFLLSDKAKFITGQVLPVNGGFVIR